jgi:hypothetical protein
MRSQLDAPAGQSITVSTYRLSPTIVRLLLTIEAMAMDWIGIDPLMARAVLFDIRMRLALAR